MLYRDRLLLQTPQSLRESLNIDVRIGTDVGASGGSGVATGSAVPTGPSFRDAAKEVGVDVG